MHRDLKLISLSLLIWGLGEGLFIFFQPLYLQQLGADPIQIGGILGLIGISMGVAQIPAGHISDRIGAKLLLRLSWVISTLATAIMALARSLPLFIIGMFLYGLGGAVMAPMNSYITSVRGKMSVGRALTFSIGSYNLGAMVGPLTGGLISQWLGLQPAYWIAFVLFVISTVAAFLLNEKEIADNSKDKAANSPWKNRNFNLYLVIVLLVIFAVYLPLPLTANYLKNIHSIPYSSLGILGTLTSLGYVILALTSGHWKPEIGLFLSQGLMIIFCVLIFFGNDIFLFGLAYLCACSFRYSRSMVVACSRHLVRKESTGLAFGIIETVSALGYTIAPVVAGFIADANPRFLYPVSAFTLTIVLLISILTLKKINNALKTH